MKMHQSEFLRGMLIRNSTSWNQQSQLIETPASSPTLSTFYSHSLLPNNTTTTFRFDLKSFIKPSNNTNVSASEDKFRDRFTQMEESWTHPGGTRWNPTQEQIGILDKLYKGGMRTPNAKQIEQITSQLARYGKIEGKNVFYWFQNHKARQRQKLKRLANSPPTSVSSTTSSMEDREYEEYRVKKKRSTRREAGGDETLELFPLHPECR